MKAAQALLLAAALAVNHAENRMHGRDERLPVRSFADGLVFHYRLLKAFAA